MEERTLPGGGRLRAGSAPRDGRLRPGRPGNNPQEAALGVPMKTESSPRAHALWMFVADLFAAGVPVVPFLLFPIDTARLVSLVVTGALMAALGVIGRLVTA